MNNLTIYFNEKQISFLEKDQDLQLIDKKRIVLSKANTKAEVKKDIDWFFGQQGCEQLIFMGQEINQIKSWFWQLFVIIEAAGGFIHNKDGALFIYRNGKWDLPKGKLDKGEQPAEAAIRECEEECAVSGLKIKRELPSTYHIYPMKGKLVLKRTFWYEMTAPQGQKLKPQTEEGIEKVKWFKKGQLAAVNKNTFPSITDVIQNMKWK